MSDGDTRCLKISNLTGKGMTDFRQDKAIYLQMAERICDEIISGKYSPGERIPSVRELSVYLGVNANTAVRAYENLSLQGIIQTRRGLGFFVTENAKDRILQARRQRFMDDTLPELFRQMQMLDIPVETLAEKWDEWKQNSKISNGKA